MDNMKHRITPRPAPKAPTPGFIPKPKPTPELVERKKTKPAGFCADVAEQKSRIEQNREARRRAAAKDRNRLGKFGDSGRSIVRKMLTSPKAMFGLAVIAASMNVVAAFFQGIGASIGALIAGSAAVAGNGSGATPVTPVATRPVERRATPVVTTQGKAPKPAAAGGSGGGKGMAATVPVARPPNPSAERAAKIRASLEQRIEEQFGKKFQPENYRRPLTAKEHGAMFDHLAVMLRERRIGENAEFMHLAMIGRLYPDLEAFLFRSVASEGRFMKLHERYMELSRKLGPRAVGADVVDHMLDELNDAAAEWKATDGARFFEMAPDQEGAVGVNQNPTANGPNAARNPSPENGEAATSEEEQAYRPPTPF